MKATSGVIPSLATSAGITTKEYLLRMYRQHGSLNKIGHALGVSEAIVKYHARAAGLQVVCILVDEEQLAEVEEVVS